MSRGQIQVTSVGDKVELAFKTDTSIRRFRLSADDALYLWALIFVAAGEARTGGAA